MTTTPPLTLLPMLVTLPAIGALGLLIAPVSAAVSRRLTLGLMLLVAALAATLLGVDTAPGPRLWLADWAPSIGTQALLGIDGLSLPLVLLTAALCPLALLASEAINQRVKTFCVLMLLLETGMLGVFLSLDFVLFYVCWELILIPMYFLIGLWGGANRQAAALKFFVFTLIGSLLMLAGGLIAYGHSDLTPLSATQLAAAGVFGPHAVASSGAEATAMQEAWLATGSPSATNFDRAQAEGHALRSFNLLALAQIGSSTDQFAVPLFGGHNAAWWAFVLLLAGMAIKLPAVPLHTWLPAAHVEAPTGVSMLLAGVLLKLGGYGLVRIAWPLCPAAAAELAWLVAGVGAISIVWGALAALAQDDFKRLVAYSSVSHMGYVLLGLAAGSVATSSGGAWLAERWTLGATGAVFQMVAHGVTSAGLFFAVGVVYERFGHRDLRRLGGLINPMPLGSGLAIVLFMASLGVPGLCGFVGELLPLLAAWQAHPLAVAAAAAATVLTALYTLRAIRLAYFGADAPPDDPRALEAKPLRATEILVLAPLALAAIVLGVRPQPLLERIEPAIAARAHALQAPSHTSATAKLPTFLPLTRHDAPDAGRTTRR
ncbi:complex I subunit 4 family protein [Botrimarina hoheduenensis]|uniref:NADH-quinone oxidoreductase subunit M n=1 Tax=Botrimarina hoheduenensis TaxID=2528000 RepID=A0A5C5WEM4_9BACT|nr:NADH-quinone oxidoreductase subunit M [Botrimarina hoheduenensis]TWT48521.1 NADH-quinone oxidoreductase subunit M [Botrimarina hoheduenensis]